MVRIVLVSHGDFCLGLLNSYEMIAGKNEQISIIKLTDNGIGEFSQQFTQKIEELIVENDVLIMTDIKGGTPFNEAYNFYLQFPEKIRVVPGMNLPMLIETGLQLSNELGLEKLYRLAITIGKAAIEEIGVESKEEEEIDF